MLVLLRPNKTGVRLQESEGPRLTLRSMRNASFVLAAEVVFWSCVIVVFMLLLQHVLRLVSLKTLTTLDGFSLGAPSIKIGRNVGALSRFHCIAMLSAVSVAVFGGCWYSALGPWFLLVDCPSKSLTCGLYETYYEKAKSLYTMVSPESLEGILGIYEILGMVSQHDYFHRGGGRRGARRRRRCRRPGP